MPIFIFLFGVNYMAEWTVLLPLVLAVYFGTNLGKRMLGLLPEATFKLLFKIVLTFISVRLILFGIIQ
jgi:uncharacterized membrane protein YfcA